MLSKIGNAVVIFGAEALFTINGEQTCQYLFVLFAAQYQNKSRITTGCAVKKPPLGGGSLVVRRGIEPLLVE